MPKDPKEKKKPGRKPTGRKVTYKSVSLDEQKTIQKLDWIVAHKSSKSRASEVTELVNREYEDLVGESPY